MDSMMYILVEYKYFTYIKSALFHGFFDVVQNPTTFKFLLRISHPYTTTNSTSIKNDKLNVVYLNNRLFIIAHVEEGVLVDREQRKT